MLQQMTLFHYFQWLSNYSVVYIYVCVYIHTYICIYINTFSLSIHLLMDIVCFHVLAIVSSAAVNMGVHASF